MQPYTYFGVHLTSFCPIACRHCCTHSSPTASREVAPIELVRALGRATLRRNPHARMVVTGGEPLAARGALRDVVAVAVELGVPISLHSNGFWGDKSWAQEQLQQLRAQSVTRLNLSIDDYHLEHLSAKTVARAAVIALGAGMELRVCVVSGPLSTLRPDGVLARLGLSPDDTRVSVVAAELSRMGLAESLPDEVFADHAAAIRGSGCSVVFNPVLYANGELSPCCGPAFSSTCRPGLWPELRRMAPASHAEAWIEAELSRWKENPLLAALHREGPLALHERMSRDARLDPPRGRVSSSCDACNRLCGDPRLRSSTARAYAVEVTPTADT